jgi:hypothetical protein
MLELYTVAVVGSWLLVAGVLRWGENFSGGGGASSIVLCARAAFFEFGETKPVESAMGGEE